MDQESEAENFDDFFENMVVEHRGPKIGIWWYHDRRVALFTEEVGDVIANSAGLKASSELHIERWREAKKYLGIKHGEYEDYQRGRVIAKGKRFKVVCSEELSQDVAALSIIMRKFSLPISLTRVQIDQHYHIHTQEELDASFDDE